MIKMDVSDHLQVDDDSSFLPSQIKSFPGTASSSNEMSPERTFRQFCKLPVSIQRASGRSRFHKVQRSSRWSTQIIKSGSTSTPKEQIDSYAPARTNRSRQSADRSTTPNSEYGLVHISKSVPEGSRARPQSETMQSYLRPEIDILYFPDLITLDAAQFGANVRNLAFGLHSMKYLSLRTRSGQIIRYIGNLKTIYTLCGSTILSDGFKERLFCAELTMKDVKKGEL